ncbi:hypothetical protein EV127DRAFT_428485 [Xylaria flabelliformis]|nr:hypothetical protein EV127DRAFT_428485 [Xylaria flabelliformis]
MEVVGLVAAIPGLIEITQKTISVIRTFSDQKLFVAQITELLGQLELIQNVLRDIQDRLKSKAIHHSNLSRLNTATQSLKSQLSALCDLFQPVTTGPGRKAKAFHRARLLICGLEGKIKKCHERLNEATSSLTLIIAAQNEAIDQENLTISRSNFRLKLNEVLLPCTNSFIPQNLQGTCEWIWSHPSFCEWQQAPAHSSPVGHEHRIMCIYGPKGCGKSVLATSLVKKLESPDNLAICFSFWAGSDDQRKLLAFLRTFLWHVIQKIPDDSLTQISAPLLKSLPLTEKTLEDVISAAFKDIKSRVYCIIDGIDESIDDWTQPGAGGLRLVLDLAKRHTNLSIVLLGRDALMRSATKLTPLRIEVTEELIRPDINQLILHHLNNSLKIQDAATRQFVQETLQESSRVMFLWVTLIFSELNRCQLPSEIDRTLRQVPRDLDREYHRLFVCLQKRLGGTRHAPSLSMERAKCLLSWIITAPEPLTYEELRCAFAISQCPDAGYEQYMLSEDGITDTCGDFIRVSGGRYHIAHASIIEFLTRPIKEWQYEDETIDYFCIDVLQSQSLMCLGCINYFQRTDMGYPFVDASVAMSHIGLPIFSCALKFALLYLMRTYASEYRKRVWEYLEDFMKTSRFCPLVEYGFLALQSESAASSEQLAEIMSFISWLFIKGSVDQLPITLSFLRAISKEELVRREKTFGPDNDRFRTWKSLDMLIASPSEAQTMLELQDVEEDSSSKSTEMVSNSLVDRPRRTMNVKARRAAEHTAVLNIGHMVASKASFPQTLATLAPRFTSIVPELLPIPFLIFLALRETNRAREDRYWSSALKRLAGTNSVLEAYCVFQLGMCRYWDKCDEAFKDLNRSRQIATNLPSSLHVDALLCATLYWLARYLLGRNRVLEAQETVSELQQRLSKGPTKGYISTPLERKLYCSIFWDDWKAEILAGIAECYVWYTNDCHTKALSILDSNIQLYRNPGHGRLKASILAHYTLSEALYRQWKHGDGELPCELTHKCEAACHMTLQLVKFPDPVEHIHEQWIMLETLCCLLLNQHRHHEVKELISRVPPGFPAVTSIKSVYYIAACAAYLGDFETGEALLEPASLGIHDRQVSLLQSESKHITNLIAALIKVRPILRLWLRVSLCHQHCGSEDIPEYSHERDFWWVYGKDTRTTAIYYCELWEIYYIRYLSLADYDNNYAHDGKFLGRAFDYEVRNDRQYVSFAFACEKFASEYARRQKYEAAAVVIRYLVSDALQRGSIDPFQWSLYYTALFLHFAFRDEEALLALCKFMLLQNKKCTPGFYLWCYFNIGILCFKIGRNHETNGNPLSAVEFFKLAMISFTRTRDNAAPSTEKYILEWLSASQSALERLGVAMAYREPTASPQVNHDVRYRDRFPKHQSCPDLRARYLKEGQPHRTAYHDWRKQAIKSA